VDPFAYADFQPTPRLDSDFEKQIWLSGSGGWDFVEPQAVKVPPLLRWGRPVKKLEQRSGLSINHSCEQRTRSRGTGISVLNES